MKQVRLSKSNLKKITSLIIFLVLVWWSAGDDPADKVANHSPAGSLQGPYTVVRVVDGDTFILDMNGTEQRVRLIGIDTPESVHPDQEKNVEYGKIASAFSKSSLGGKKVEIELDVQEKDKYGRLLVYLYTDGKMFNKILLEEGHAKVSTYPPNVKYVDDFTALQQKAREGKKGIWAY